MVEAELQPLERGKTCDVEIDERTLSTWKGGRQSFERMCAVDDGATTKEFLEMVSKKEHAIQGIDATFFIEIAYLSAMAHEAPLIIRVAQGF